MAFAGGHMLIGGSFGQPYGMIPQHPIITSSSWNQSASISTSLNAHLQNRPPSQGNVANIPSGDEPNLDMPPSRITDVRDLADKWAIGESFVPEQATEFKHLMKMALSNYIPKSKLQGSVQIDSGSFGIIYRSFYDGTEVAVKEIGQSSDGQSNIKTKMRELLLELRVLVQVRHPNIVGFWGSVVDFPTSASRSPSIGLVFEMCNKGSLHRALFENSNSRAKLTCLQKVKISNQVAVGLAYLHSKLIIHRDLNTRNILLSSDLTAKIADFGCARCLSEQTGKLKTTTILGSPAYMAPEQMQGAELSEAVDIWALSMMLWEMMMETKPWEGVYNDFNRLKDAILRGERVPIPATGGSYPAAYVSMIKAGMRSKPEDRPTATAMQRELLSAQKEVERKTMGKVESGSQN